MPRYIIRQNCEYSVLVEANSHEEAENKAANIPIDQWNAAWSTIEGAAETDEVANAH